MPIWLVYLDVKQAHQVYQAKNWTLKFSTETCCPNSFFISVRGWRSLLDWAMTFYVLLDKWLFYSTPNLLSTPISSILEIPLPLTQPLLTILTPNTQVWVTIISHLVYLHDDCSAYVSRHFYTRQLWYFHLSQIISLLCSKPSNREKAKTTSQCFPSEIWISQMKFEVVTTAYTSLHDLPALHMTSAWTFHHISLPHHSLDSLSTTSSLMTPARLQCRGLTSATPSLRILWLHLFIWLTPLLFLLPPQLSPFLTILSKRVYMWAYTHIHMHACTRPFNPYSFFPLDSLYFLYFYLGFVTNLCTGVPST